MKQHVLVFFLPVISLCGNVFSQVVSPNIRIHPNPTGYQFEPSITTRASNPDTIFAVARARNNNAPSTGWYYSVNGGTTWSGSDTLPAVSNPADPVAAIDLNGNLFVSGFFGSNVLVARSTNGGVSWTQTTVGTTSGREKPHMTIDRYPGSPYKNYVHVAYTDLNLVPAPVYFSRSTDLGQSFISPFPISGGIGGDAAVAPNLAVGPDSLLYATWSGFDTKPWVNPQPLHLGFNKSTDGGLTWGTGRSLSKINYNGGAHGVSFFNFPIIAVDGSSGPRRGWIYVVYAEKNPASPDIFLIRSTDRGISWSEPVKVNQDNSGKEHWQPWLSVDPSTGNVFIVYYDSRNFPANDSAHVYLSASIDGGQTFEDFLVSDSPFRPWGIISSVPTPSYMGSYIGVTALNGVVWPCWMGTRSGTHQVYTARVTFSIYSGPKAIHNASSVSFDTVEVGKLKNKTMVITNYGDDTLRISNILSSNPVFTARTTSMDIAPGKSVTDTLRFIPTAVGPVSGTLVISSNGPPADTIRVSGTGNPPSSVNIVSSELPQRYTLGQNYPNPFNPTTTIRFSIPRRSFVTLTVFDVLGREVGTLISEELNAGVFSTQWDARQVASGIYLYRMQANEFVEIKKLLLLR